MRESISCVVYFILAGEVSLPGGKRDDGDADGDVAMASRRPRRRFGLDPSLAEVVTVLPPGITVVHLVGIHSDKNAYRPALNLAEVGVIFNVPLEMFPWDENRRVEEREWMGDKYLLHLFDYQTVDDKYVIFALTAGILIRTASVAYQLRQHLQCSVPNFGIPRMFCVVT
ncbi:hypothetical protein NL676_012805 [Syzygium grande]|nr:hypothetical protein NL676_012805 [Syzygium grande]